jgi:flagellar biosynthesis protein FlhA
MLAQKVLERTRQALERHTQRGDPPVLLTSPLLREPLSRFFRATLPELAVMAISEIPDERIIRITTSISATDKL